MKKLISMLTVAAMLLSAQMTATVFAEETSETGTVIGAYEDFGAYTDASGNYPQGVRLKNYPTADDASTEGIDERVSNVNGGYGWDGKWYTGNDKENTNFSNVLGFTEADRINMVYGYSCDAQRDLAQVISLSEKGSYTFEAQMRVQNAWSDFFSGLILLSDSYAEVMRFGITGTEIKENNVTKEIFTPSLSVSGTPVENTATVAGGGRVYSLKAVLTVNPDGNDSITYTIKNNSDSADAVTISSNVELGTGTIKTIKLNWGQPTYFKTVSAGKTISGTKEYYGESVVAQDNLMVSGYGYNSAATVAVEFDPSANLGTGWDGPWTYSSTDKWKYYTDWRKGVVANWNGGSILTRNFANALNFSKDGKYEIRFKNLYQDAGGEANRGVSLRSGNSEIITFGEDHLNSKIDLRVNGTTITGTEANFPKGQYYYQNVAEITVNSSGADTIKYKRYLNGAEEPATWNLETVCELDGKYVDNVYLSWWEGGLADISVSANSVTAVREATAAGEKVYMDFMTPSAANTVSMLNDVKADVSYIKDADNKIYSAVVEYNYDDLLAYKENAVLVGGIRIPIAISEENYPLTRESAVIISEDFDAYVKAGIEGSDLTKLTGGKGLSGSWSDATNWILQKVSERNTLWCGYNSAVSRALTTNIDFSKDGVYDITFNSAKQNGWGVFMGMSFLDSDGATKLSLGVRGLTGKDSNGDDYTDSNRPHVCTVGRGNTWYDAETPVYNGGSGNVWYTTIAKITVNADGNDEIKIKRFKTGTEEPTGWDLVLSDVELGTDVISKIKLDCKDVGGFTDFEIKKDNVVSYRRSSDGKRTYMFLDNAYLGTKQVYAVGYNNNRITGIKYFGMGNDFSFDNDTDVKVFIWDNMKPFMDFVSVAK